MRKTNTMTKVRHLMESDFEMISPDASLLDAARKMRDISCGFLPVGVAGQQPIGVITDRDIVVRALADEADPLLSQVSDFMSRQVFCCEESDDLEEAAETMSDNEVSRLMVLDESGLVCGLLTFGRIMRNNGNLQELSRVVARAAAGATLN